MGKFYLNTWVIHEQKKNKVKVNRLNKVMCYNTAFYYNKKIKLNKKTKSIVLTIEGIEETKEKQITKSKKL